MGRPRSGTARASFGFLLTGRMLSAFLQSFVLVLLAREVSPSTFGVVATFVSVITVIGAVADLGLETVALRSSAAGGGDIGAISRLHRWTVGAACLLILVVSLAISSVVPDVVQALPLVVWVWIERRLNMHTGLLVAHGSANRVALALTSARLVCLLLFIASAWAWMAPPVLAYACASVVGSLIGCGVALQKIRPSMGTPWRALLRGAQPFWRASMSGLLRTLDVPVVQVFAGPAAAGLYALPARAVAPMRLVATSMSTTAIPFAARGDRRRLRELEQLTALVAILMASVLAATWVFIDDVIVAVLGSAYAGSADPIRILAIGVVLNVLGAFWSGVLQGIGHERFVAVVGAWLVLAFFLLVAWGSSAAGAEGAAVAVTATFALQLMVFGGARMRMWAW